ncbi:MAG: Ig-like domain-containing protein [Isosphaeraceae bacterium]
METRGVAAVDAAGNVLVNGHLRENGPSELATLTPGRAAAVLPLPELVRDVWGTAMSGNGHAAGYALDYSTVPSGLRGLAWKGGRRCRLERPPGAPAPLDVPTRGVGGYAVGRRVGHLHAGAGRSRPTRARTAGDAIAVAPAPGLPEEEVTLTASLRSAAGRPSPGQVVRFSLGDAPIGQARTDAAGTARMRWRIPAGAKVMRTRCVLRPPRGPRFGPRALDGPMGSDLGSRSPRRRRGRAAGRPSPQARACQRRPRSPAARWRLDVGGRTLRATTDARADSPSCSPSRARRPRAAACPSAPRSPPRRTTRPGAAAAGAVSVR